MTQSGGPVRRCRVAVAVSGGVDSLSALLILRDAGHEVMALHGRFFSPQPDTAHGSTAADPVPGLAAVCRRLAIPFHVCDLRAHFARHVLEPFARAYAAGRTPNPCALCNRAVKFGALLAAALALGADRLATGHYARLAPSPSPASPTLMRAQDARKDQSYFLALVPSQRLARALFPLAGMRKADCVARVAQAGLAVPLARESQDICFAGSGPGAYRDFLAAYWQARHQPPPPSGPMLLAETRHQALSRMRHLGRHRGLWRYTEGQRRGLGIAHSEPLHVLSKHGGGNALVVGPRALLGMDRCVAAQVNVLVPPQDWPHVVEARLRHGQHGVPARARLVDNRLRIELLETQFPSAPGQIAALYDATGRVLAGGIVEDMA